MASHQELVTEWTMLDANYNNWTVEDLQVAAELGRTLLERNEELENDVKSQQAIIDDQAQEIEFLTKQNSAMKEENLTRAKFYEQLESTIFELERTNTQLTRKHDSDKKRIRSLCENIDYLERKCEEMSSTLETIRDENKKQYGSGAGKLSRNGYWSSNGSDSSEDDSYLFYKRRSHSLQDLRDYTPSPDEFDSHNSHSPELKASEAEFIESLESRIEELIAAKKKELDKVQQLETQMRILIQENANLQEQLSALQTEKEEEISELRKQLLDTSNYAQQTLSLSSRLSSISSRIIEDEHSSGSEGSPVPICSSTFNSGNANEDKSQQHQQQQPSAFQNYPTSNHLLQSPSPQQPTTVVCKRCSAEINLLNLVNSIESETDPDEMEFSSLEHELARATGRDKIDGYNGNNNNRRKLGSIAGSSSPDRNDVWNYWGMRRPSLLDYFLFGGRDDEVGEEACETQVDSCQRTSSRRGRRREATDDDDEEDPCLKKDRQSEKEGCEATNNGSSSRMNNQIPVKKLKLPVKIPYEDEAAVVEEEETMVLEGAQMSSTRIRRAMESDSHDFCDNKILVNDNDTAMSDECDGAGVTCGEDQVDSITGIKSSSNKKPNSKRKTGFLWWLAWLIVMVLGVFEFVWTLVTLMFFVTAAAVLPKSCSSTLLSLSTSRFLRPVRILDRVSSSQS